MFICYDRNIQLDLHKYFIQVGNISEDLDLHFDAHLLKRDYTEELGRGVIVISVYNKRKLQFQMLKVKYCCCCCC